MPNRAGFFAQLKEQLVPFNEQFEQQETTWLAEEERRVVLGQFGVFQPIPRWKKGDSDIDLKGRGVTGVDGSINHFGQKAPYVLTFAQALAKDTRDRQGKENVFTTKVMSLYHEARGGAENFDVTEWTKQCNQELVQMELTVALEAMRQHRPYLVLFDGSIWRLMKKQEGTESVLNPIWQEIVRLALKEDILLAGVVEDIGSYDFYDFEKNEGPRLERYIPFGFDDYHILDSNLFHGLLQEGEVFRLRTGVFDRYEGQFDRTYARFSKDPAPIAIDTLPAQQQRLDEMLYLIHSMTPRDSRGIPSWIDIVDREVKISNDEVEMLIQTTMRADILKKYFNPKRLNR